MFMKLFLFIALTFVILSIGSTAQTKKENSRLILKVEDFGVAGDGKTDDGPALRKLFEKASALNHPAKIVFQDDATYYLGKEEKHPVGSMFMERANNLIVDGNNCLLLVDPHRRPFEIYRSKNVTIRNFQIDYSPLPYTQGRIVKIDNSSGYLEFKVDDGYPLPYVRDDSYYVDGRVSDCVTVNGENLKFYQGHSRISGIKELGNKTYAVTYRMHRQDKARVGDYFVMKVWPPAMERVYNSSLKPSEFGEHYVANYANIQVNHSDNVTIENIISYASPKMTVNARSTSDLIIRRLVITRRPGRVLASCSDGIHLKGNERQPLIENCYIEGTLDDAIHIKMSGDRVEEVASARKVRIKHMDTRDNTNLGIGKTVMVFDAEENRQLAMAVITDFEHIDHRSGWVTLDKDIENLSVGTRLYLQAENEAIIQNCQFGTQLQRAILTHQPTTIRNCAILDNGKGLDQALASGGIEGPPSQRVIFDNVAFDNLSVVALQVGCPSKEYNQLGTPQLIVKNCLFNLPDGVPAVQTKNSNGVSMIGNKFGYLNKKPKEKEYFQLNNTEMIQFSDNAYQKGWFIWDSDKDGLADALEIEGDADGDGIENKLDTDSNNNGITDFDEFKMARNPFCTSFAGNVEKKESRPNILFIMTDQQHAGMMSCAGNKWLQTPALDALAREGIRYESAYSTNPVCVPSRISMSTGMMPNRLGAGDNTLAKTMEDLPENVDKNSLGKIVKRAGYDTFYGGKVHMCKQLQPLNAGYDEYFKDERIALPEACIKFIKRKRDKPFFAVASFINPHDICFAHRAHNGTNTQNVLELYKEAASLPLDKLPPLPDNFEIPKDETASIENNMSPNSITPAITMRKTYTERDWRIYRWIYNRLTEQVDKQIGKILDGLKEAGLEDNTLIIFTSDHGDMDASHRLASKSMLYEESVGVPFILKYKGVIPSGRVDKKHLVSTGLDILPTICDYVGAKIPDHLLGKSLRPLAESCTDKEWRTYVASENGWSRMIRSRKFKYIVDDSDGNNETLIDMENDPGEMKNLATDTNFRKIVEEHREYLKEWNKVSDDK
jgi:choline-sulfatase